MQETGFGRESPSPVFAIDPRESIFSLGDLSSSSSPSLSDMDVERELTAMGISLEQDEFAWRSPSEYSLARRMEEPDAPSPPEDERGERLRRMREAELHFDRLEARERRQERGDLERRRQRRQTEQERLAWDLRMARGARGSPSLSLSEDEALRRCKPSYDDVRVLYLPQGEGQLAFRPELCHPIPYCDVMASVTSTALHRWLQGGSSRQPPSFAIGPSSCGTPTSPSPTCCPWNTTCCRWGRWPLP